MELLPPERATPLIEAHDNYVELMMVTTGKLTEAAAEAELRRVARERHVLKLGTSEQLVRIQIALRHRWHPSCTYSVSNRPSSLRQAGHVLGMWVFSKSNCLAKWVGYVMGSWQSWYPL